MALVLALTAACAQELPELTWHGEHLSFGSSRSETPAAGTLTYLDEYAGVLKDRVGADPDLRVEYYWLSDNGVNDNCTVPQHVAGCTFETSVFSTFPASVHELVHATDPATPTFAFVEEGLATAWQGRANTTGQISGRDQLLERIQDFEYTPENYWLSAHFTGWLLTTFGDGALLSLRENADWHGGYEDYEDAFKSAYGVDLVEAVEEYAGYEDCEPRELVESVRECRSRLTDVIPCSRKSIDGYDVEAVATNLVASADLANGSEVAIGPGADGKIWTSVVVDLPPAGGYRLWVRSDSPVDARLNQCGSGCRETLYVPTRPLEQAPTDWPPEAGIPEAGQAFGISPGLYVLQLERSAGSDATEQEVHAHCVAFDE